MVLPLVGEYVAAFFEPLHTGEGVFLFNQNHKCLDKESIVYQFISPKNRPKTIIILSYINRF